MNKYLFFFFLIFTCRNANAQMFDELKTKQKELNPKGIKIYLEPSAGVGSGTNFFYADFPRRVVPYISYIDPEHISSTTAQKIVFPLNIAALFKLSDKINLGAGVGYTRYSGSYSDGIVGSDNNFSLSTLIYYAKAEYKASDGLRNSFIVGLEAGTFAPMNSTLPSVNSNYYAALVPEMVFKVSGHVQILLNWNIFYGSYYVLNNSGDASYFWGMSGDIGIRLGI